MINKAIARITDEMMKMDDPLARMIEEHLTEKCTTERIAEKILNPDKTLEKIHKKIWDEAKKRRKGNGAFIPDQQIYAMVDKYYGIDEAAKRPAEPAVSINVLDLL